MAKPKVIYVKWRDASQHMTDTPVNDIQLLELEEVAFLHKEDEEKLVLSMESDQVDEDLRLWLAIPKVNIVERYDISLKDFVKWLKGREKRGSNQFKYKSGRVGEAAVGKVDGKDEPAVVV